MRVILGMLLATTACLSTPDRPYGDSGCVHELTELGSTNDREPWMSPDHLELVFDRQIGNSALYTARRANRDDPFGAPRPLAGLSQCSDAAYPFLSTDSLRLWFNCSGKLWSAHRPTRDMPFEQVQPEPGFVNEPAGFSGASVDETELTMTFAGSNGHLYLVKRASTSDVFDSSAAQEIPAPGLVWAPSLVNDGALLLFGVCVGSPCGDRRIYRVTRDSGWSDATEATDLGHVTGAEDFSAQETFDGTVTFSSERAGGGRVAIFQCH